MLVHGHVRTVYYFESSEQSMHAVLKAKVNPSQEAQTTHEAWVAKLYVQMCVIK